MSRLRDRIRVILSQEVKGYLENNLDDIIQKQVEAVLDDECQAIDEEAAEYINEMVDDEAASEEVKQAVRNALDEM